MRKHRQWRNGRYRLKRFGLQHGKQVLGWYHTQTTRDRMVTVYTDLIEGA